MEKVMSKIMNENMETIKLAAKSLFEVPGFENLGPVFSYTLEDDYIKLFFNGNETSFRIKLTPSLLSLGYGEFDDEIMDLFNAYLTGYYDNFDVKVMAEKGFTHKEDFKLQLPNLEKCIKKSKEDGNYPSLVECIRKVLLMKKNAGKGSQLGMSFCNFGDANDISFTILDCDDKYWFGGGIINHGPKIGWSIHS